MEGHAGKTIDAAVAGTPEPIAGVETRIPSDVVGEAILKKFREFVPILQSWPTVEQVEYWISVRKVFKRGGDYEVADDIREKIRVAGYELRDNKDGTTIWLRET